MFHLRHQLHKSTSLVCKNSGNKSVDISSHLTVDIATIYFACIVLVALFNNRILVELETASNKRQTKGSPSDNSENVSLVCS